MADYYSLLSRAVANLPKSSPASARKAIYERARKALSNQLRSLKPPLPEGDITREETALQAAISKLEAEFDTSAAPPVVEASPPAEPAPVAAQPPRPVPSPPTRPAAPLPPLRPAPRSPTLPQTPTAPVRPVAPTIPTPTVSSPTSESFRSAAPSVVHPSVASAFTPASAPAVQVPGASPSPAQGAPPVQGKPQPVQSEEAAAATWDNIRAAAPPLLAGASEGLAATSPPFNPAAKILTPPASRSDNDARPSAPSPARTTGINPWPWAAAGLVLCLVGVVAVAAFLLREKPQDLTIKEPVESPSPSASPGSGPKIAERVGGSPAAVPTPSPSAPPVTPATPPTPSSAPSPGVTAAAPVATAPAQNSAPAVTAVAARAAMLVATTQDAQKPAVSLGSAVWSAVPANPGQPGSAGVKAEVDIPDLKMHATMILRKNVDASLPASHTIDLRLTFDDASPIKGVKDIGVPQMRRDDPPSVEALAGVRVKINDTYFLVGLNRTDSDITHNMDAINSNGWFDFPMLLADDRIAKLTFEKSADGERVIADAMAAWK